MVVSARLIRSPLSVAGMVLTTASAVVFLVVFLADLFGLHTNPYLGIVFFLILPAIFVFGLVLIPRQPGKTLLKLDILARCVSLQQRERDQTCGVAVTRRLRERSIVVHPRLEIGAQARGSRRTGE